MAREIAWCMPVTKDRTIFIKNIYYMLSYAFYAPKQKGYEQVAAESFDHIHDLFAALLASGVSRQLKQGLARTYVGRREDLSVIRGKIDLPGAMRAQWSRKRQMPCIYDELSADNLYNEILKTALLLLLRRGEVQPRYKTMLKRSLRYFSDVDTIDPRTVPWQRLTFDRQNQSYRMLMGICQLLFEGMLQTTEAGTMRLASFIDDQRMSRLYEKFILAYYQEEWKDRLHVAAPQIAWALDTVEDAFLPRMQSDVVLRAPARTLIIDAKYYARTMREHYGAQTLHSHNLYQIFTYVKNQAAAPAEAGREVSGLLLYARTDEAVQPDQTYQMNGHRIAVQTLDLGQDFSEIAAQLDRIAVALL